MRRTMHAAVVLGAMGALWASSSAAGQEVRVEAVAARTTTPPWLAPQFTINSFPQNHAIVVLDDGTAVLSFNAVLPNGNSTTMAYAVSTEGDGRLVLKGREHLLPPYSDFRLTPAFGAHNIQVTPDGEVLAFGFLLGGGEPLRRNAVVESVNGSQRRVISDEWEWTRAYPTGRPLRHLRLGYTRNSGLYQGDWDGFTTVGSTSRTIIARGQLGPDNMRISRLQGVVGPSAAGQMAVIALGSGRSVNQFTRYRVYAFTAQHRWRVLMGLEETLDPYRVPCTFKPDGAMRLVGMTDRGDLVIRVNVRRRGGQEAYEYWIARMGQDGRSHEPLTPLFPGPGNTPPPPSGIDRWTVQDIVVDPSGEIYVFAVVPQWLTQAWFRWKPLEGLENATVIMRADQVLTGLPTFPRISQGTYSLAVVPDSDMAYIVWSGVVDGIWLLRTGEVSQPVLLEGDFVEPPGMEPVPVTHIKPTVSKSVTGSGFFATTVWSGSRSMVIRASAPIESCYADCDTSTGRGRLDVFDFLCFSNLYMMGDPMACDCDTGTGPGVCDMFDFICFQNAFAAGCP